MSWWGGGLIRPTPGVEWRVLAIHGYTLWPGSWPPSPGLAPCAILIWMSSALVRYSEVTPNRPDATCLIALRRSGSCSRSLSSPPSPVLDRAPRRFIAIALDESTLRNHPRGAPALAAQYGVAVPEPHSCPANAGATFVGAAGTPLF